MAAFATVASIVRDLQAAVTVQPYTDNYVETVTHGCPLSHTSKINASYLVIDKPAIRAQPKDMLHLLKQFSKLQYEKFMTDVAGKEHYTLLHWLTNTYHTKEDCRHVVDIGTRYVASSLALGATGVPVKTFDIPKSKERLDAFRGNTEQEWQEKLQATSNVQIQFHNLDLLKVSDSEFRDYMSTWLVALDTFHLPYSVPFEREFLNRVVSMEPRFEGIMLLDDIHLNQEMKDWWQELLTDADKWGFKPYDVTSVGHFSGTGLLDFSGKVVIKE